MCGSIEREDLAYYLSKFQYNWYAEFAESIVKKTFVLRMPGACH